MENPKIFSWARQDRPASEETALPGLFVGNGALDENSQPYRPTQGHHIAVIIRPIVLKIFKTTPAATSLLDMKLTNDSTILMLQRPYDSDKLLQPGSFVEAKSSCDQYRCGFEGKVISDNGKTILIKSDNVSNAFRKHAMKTILRNRIEKAAAN